MPDQKVKFITPEEGTYDTYANNFLFNWTAFDFRMRFGHLVNITDDLEFVIKQDVSVTMSWTEAKDFLKVLKMVIDEFEKINGPIKTPQIPVFPQSTPPSP